MDVSICKEFSVALTAGGNYPHWPSQQGTCTQVWGQAGAGVSTGHLPLLGPCGEA